MKKTIHDYINAKNNILKQFGCTIDYPIKPMITTKWAVSGDDGIFFLTYFDDKNNKNSFAIAKKDGEPLIFRNKEYTMIIAIDCIKIAFVFKNKNTL